MTNLAFTQPDKLGERAKLAQDFIEAVLLETEGGDERAKLLEKQIIAQLRFTGHLSTDENKIGAFIEWQGVFDFKKIHVNYGNTPQEGESFDEAWFADPANADHWLEVDPATGEVINL